MHRLKGMTVAAVMAASVVALSGNAFAQAKIVDGPEVRWKLGAWGKPRAATQNVETLRKFLDERTGGKFKIQIGYESFGNPKELLDLLKVGSLEATNICASYHPEKLPVYSALDLPFLPIPDTTVQEKVHNAFHKHPLVLKEFAGWNAIPYMSALLPNNEFVGRGKAPKSVEDFKGMRVRALAGIGEAMRKLGCNLGGEQSGHLICLDHSTTGDGLVSALMLLGVMVREGKTLAELAKVMTRYPQVVKGFAVARKVPLDQLVDTRKVIAGVEARLGQEGRVVVRYSGTEALLRVMVEGIDERQILAAADEIGESALTEIVALLARRGEP